MKMLVHSRDKPIPSNKLHGISGNISAGQPGGHDPLQLRVRVGREAEAREAQAGGHAGRQRALGQVHRVGHGQHAQQRSVVRRPLHYAVQHVLATGAESVQLENKHA